MSLFENVHKIFEEEHNCTSDLSTSTLIVLKDYRMLPYNQFWEEILKGRDILKFTSLDNYVNL